MLPPKGRRHAASWKQRAIDVGVLEVWRKWENHTSIICKPPRHELFFFCDSSSSDPTRYSHPLSAPPNTLGRKFVSQESL
ncbi:hypothetical protein I79_018231 [Cricetulus griseus]|uniref:Uncharacterized protein n=1 Tax=Cricetulus griseus TaxID=10029 RepID=G3I456_CRIGR|nr:hypothetical protein I79_018231 [Cricetulus griseus]